MSKIEVNTVEPQCGTTLTLGGSGDTVALGSGASQTGFGRTGTVDWQTGTIKTTTFTAVNGEANFANTSGGMEDLGKEQYIQNKFDKDGNKISLTDSEKAFNRKVMEAREVASRDNDRTGYNRPRIMEEEEEIIIDDPIVEPGDTTMPYKGPRTGGVEKQVPLQRRFKTDPTQATAQYRTTPRTQDEIYKYMTEGTTGEGIGLEPFSEYQKRRRKALGLEPLGLWD